MKKEAKETVKQNAKNALIPYIKSLYPSAQDGAIENVADYVLYIIEDGCDIFYDAEAWAEDEVDDE